MNNNLLNNVNFVGMTHLDYSKISSNFTTATSNILEGHITDAKNYNIAYTNNLRTDVDKWIGEEIEHITLPVPKDITHTYVYNSNIAGEIRFWNYNWYAVNNFSPLPYPNHLVKIDVDGKLKLYYIYDPLINLTWQSGWIEPASQIIALIADSINQGVLITGVEFNLEQYKNKVELEILSIYSAIWTSSMGQFSDSDIEDLLVFRQQSNTELYAVAVRNITNDANTRMNTLAAAANPALLGRIANKIAQYIAINPAVVFFAGTGGTVIGIIYGIYQNINQINYLNSLISSINKNSNLTAPEKTQEIGYIQSNLMASNLVNIAQGYYNTSISQGFINSNVATAQTIPSIATTNITLNGTNVNSIFLAQNGGTMYNSLVFQKNTSGNPVPGFFDGPGSRVIYEPS